MTDSTRLFLGVEIAIESANQLRERAASLRAAMAAQSIEARWVAPARYHVTLKYLGWTTAEAVFAIRDRVGALLADRRELEFGLGALGAFPSLAAAKVLWIGLEGAEELAALASAADAALEEIGFAGETRPFVPHVTLARLPKVADLSAVVVGSEHRYSKTRVRAVSLYKSDVISDGSGYPEVHRWDLPSAKRQRSDLEQRNT